MNIFSGTLAGTTLAGTTLAGTTLAGITLEGSTLYDTSAAPAPKEGNCQSDEFDPACPWQVDVQGKADTLGISPQDFCDAASYSPFGQNPEGCSTAKAQGKWPYTVFKPVANFCAPGYRVAKGGGCEIDPANPPTFKQDFCKDGYLNVPGQGCIPKAAVPQPAPGIAIADNTKMIVGAVVVLGLIAYFASAKKGNYARNCD